MCVLDDTCDEWLDEPGQILDDQEGSAEGNVDRRNVLEQIHRMPSCPRAEEGLISEKQVYVTRSEESMSRDAVRKARAKEPTHMQVNNVCEIVSLSEDGSLTKVRSKWLQET